MVHAKLGLHLRPAGLLCQKACEFEDCHIEFVYGNSIINAKSVLSVLSACVKGDTELLLRCEGKNEEEALEVLTELIENGMI